MWYSYKNIFELKWRESGRDRERQRRGKRESESENFKDGGVQYFGN